MIDLEKIKARVLAGENLEKILESFDWSGFEQAIAEIFASNGFHVKSNLRFKTRRRYEIDIVAVRGNAVLCVDCKHWSGGRHKQAGLKRAVAEQKERTKEFKKFLKGDLTAQAKLNIGSSFCAYPLIVTLFEEDLIKVGRCLVVPAWKLNDFLLDIESYLK